MGHLLSGRGGQGLGITREIGTYAVIGRHAAGIDARPVHGAPGKKGQDNKK
jgi:hypothetical protein